MSMLSQQELLRALQARGLVAEGATFSRGENATATPRPWYIRLMLGVSGWLAGLFVLAAMALFLPHRSSGEMTLTGLTLLAAAWGLYESYREGPLTEQMALALSIAGQCLLLFAFAETRQSLSSFAGFAMVLQAVLVLVMPNALHRTLSMLFAICAWAVMLRFSVLGDHRAYGSTALAQGPAFIGWVMTWGPVLAALGCLLRSEAVWMASRWAAVIRPALTGLIVALAFATLVSAPFAHLLWWKRGWLFTGPALWPLLSAGAALCALAASFALRSRALMGACLIALLLHVAHFYYALGVSLLLKSLLMLSLGVALLLASRRLADPGRGQP